MASFKVGVITPGDHDWCYNGLRFATKEEAEGYGKDLYRRWTAVEKYTVTESDEPVNYRFVDGREQSVEEGAV